MRSPHVVTALLVLAAGCAQTGADSSAQAPAPRQPERPATTAAAPAVATPADASTPSASLTRPAGGEPQGQRPAPDLFEALGLRKAGPAMPEGLEIGGDCPAPRGQVDAEIAAQAGAVIPLKPGLTLVNLWNPTEREEYECMTQVIAVHRDGVDLTMRCNRPGTERTILRRICRTDLASARMLHTAVGVATVIGETGEELPETVVGATEFSLSRDEFGELARSGQTSHRYVQIGSSGRLELDAKTTLRREGTATATIAVNGAPVDLPVVRASGESVMWSFGQLVKGRVSALIVDDERFPMLVDYTHTEENRTTPRFRLYFPKVTYPGADPETELARRGRLVVHGIYFDFNSDRIRKESDPILDELGEALARHPEWTMSINGHTDDVGGDAYNLELSRRRAAAVRRVLIERHGIAAGRLRSAGFGASSPIETNDTPEGRARNRRVELVRVEDAPADPPAR